MVERTIHFVGSIPAENTEQAIRDTLRRAGPGVRSITDGETGERYRWIVHIMDSFRQNPALQLTKDGDWSSYDTATRFKIRRGHRFTADDLEMGQAARFEESYPIFQRVREDLGYQDLSYQVGIAGDLDLALFTFGPAGAFQHRRPFTEALVRDMRKIHAAAGSDVVFQIEVPVELVFMAQMPPPVRPAMAAFLARGVGKLAAGAPEGARFGIHLCLGDLGNKALGRLRTAKPLVQLANAIVKRWPAGRALEFVHAPLAAGDQPAPLEPAFYAPLSGLRLPADTRFIAGYVHEKRTLDELRRTRSMVEDSYGQPADVAAACGLGRRTREQADTNIDLARQLRTDD